MPTILDYLKIEQDKNYENPDGESLLPLMNGKLLKEKGIKSSRLARGLPVGGDLEYIDEATLIRAIEGRVAL